MRRPVRARYGRARQIFPDLENVESDRRTRPRSAGAAARASFSLSRGDRCRRSRLVRLERRQCAQASMRQVALVRLQGASVRRRGCRPQGKRRQCVHALTARWRCGSLCGRRDADLPGMHRPRAKEIRALDTEKILPSPSSQFCGAPPRK